MKNEINQQELREYMNVLIDSFGFNVMGIAKATGITRSALSTWFNHPDTGYLLPKHIINLNAYIVKILFGNGIDADYRDLLLQARNINMAIKQKRNELGLGTIKPECK